MEANNEEQLYIFKTLCNHQNVLEYFNSFSRLIKDKEFCIADHNLLDFVRCFKYLDQHNFFKNFTEIENYKDLFCTLETIFIYICDNYLKPLLREQLKNSVDSTPYFDIIALLTKVLIARTDQNIHLQPLFLCLVNYFKKHSLNHEKYYISENEREIFHNALKFLLKILKSFDSSRFVDYVTDEYLILILNSLPFSDKFSVNVFVNQMLPHLFIISNPARKGLILDYLWDKIISDVNKSSDTNEENYLYSLLCCLTEYVLKEHTEFTKVSIYDDIVWEIIQTGLTSCNSYNRKQAVYVFKVILFWLKTDIDLKKSHNEVALFNVQSTKDLLSWNDLAVLFETLEEKQVHVIEPVLPKFSRILQYASRTNNFHDQGFVLHPSWITCFLRRMLMHESKCIVKQGLSLILNLNFKNYSINLLNSELFIQVIFEAFNDQNMYTRINENDNLSLFLSSEKISGFLSSYMSAFATEQQKVDFLRYLLKLIASQSWCGVALLHLIFALTNLNCLPSWKTDDIIHIRKITQTSIKAFEPVFRSAIEYWLMKSCLLFMDWNSIHLEDLSELLSVFKSLQRHTRIWNATVTKLQEIFSLGVSNTLCINEAKVFCKNWVEKLLSVSECKNVEKADLQKYAQMLIILADSSVISSKIQVNYINWDQLLLPLTSVLNEAPKRPYLCVEKFNNILQFYTFLIIESKGNSKSTSDVCDASITKHMNFSCEFIEFIYKKLFMDLKDANNIFQFQILYNALTVFSTLNCLCHLFLESFVSFVEKCKSLPQNFLAKKFIIILLYSILNVLIKDAHHLQNLQSSQFIKLNLNLLSEIINEKIIDNLTKSHTVFLNELEKEIWFDIATKSICEFWRISSRTVVCIPTTSLENILVPLVQQAQNIFDGGPKAAVPYVISFIQSLIPKFATENTHLVRSLLSSAWKACSDLNGNEAYRPALKFFVYAVFQSCMLHDKYFDILYEYLECFQTLSENTLGIFYIVIRQICNTFPLKVLLKINFNIIPILIFALTYGPIHNKGQKVLEDTVAYINELDKDFSTDILYYNKPSIFVRVVATTYLIENLNENSIENQAIAVKLIYNLLDFDKSARNSKSSKFANSYSHRIRNRIWQTILILQPNLISKEESENFLKQILGILEFDNRQPSIRYMQEWIIFNIINGHKCFMEDFIFILENSFEKRPGFLISVLSIMVHLINHHAILTEDLVTRCFPLLINYCMAQNFAVRLYSRLGLTKLFEFSHNKNFTSVNGKYDFLSNLVSQPPESALSEKGNLYKNLVKLFEDFYFSVFHPINHFTLETIFFELPRLSNVTSEEWIGHKYFTSILTSSSVAIPCHNTDDALKHSTASTWSEKPAGQSAVIANELFDYNFQKKICPLKPENNDLSDDIGLITDLKPKNELIVVASLIDRIPNLGGLCRTCEVFGVKELIIGSLKYVEDKQFQNLAVSADRWVSIKEVKPYHLKEYLLSLKEEGYTIVGAEQTEDSQKLNNYIFPKKSALVLGHEKEGMPVDLIQLLDACAEIPQQGIIRSLNVHVSGAIFIWEYARQHVKQAM